eukprot:gnl/Chilomastix_cuspidata/3289.p1 GENE.gnl/Chilomastix_cuspidata/3289~~gnl/Chilomastix_cuspidata/3289.p1  ORF type:complete len:860 (+),score=212.06 gnl/Chilomastix_cuspidata/3289:164-2581(+)
MNISLSGIPVILTNSNSRQGFVRFRYEDLIISYEQSDAGFEFFCSEDPCGSSVTIAVSTLQSGGSLSLRDGSTLSHPEGEAFATTAPLHVEGFDSIEASVRGGGDLLFRECGSLSLADSSSASLQIDGVDALELTSQYVSRNTTIALDGCAAAQIDYLYALEDLSVQAHCGDVRLHHNTAKGAFTVETEEGSIFLNASGVPQTRVASEKGDLTLQLIPLGTHFNISAHKVKPDLDARFTLEGVWWEKKKATGVVASGEFMRSGSRLSELSAELSKGVANVGPYGAPSIAEYTFSADAVSSVSVAACQVGIFDKNSFITRVGNPFATMPYQNALDSTSVQVRVEFEDATGQTTCSCSLDSNGALSASCATDTSGGADVVVITSIYVILPRTASVVALSVDALNLQIDVATIQFGAVQATSEIITVRALDCDSGWIRAPDVEDSYTLSATIEQMRISGDFDISGFKTISVALNPPTAALCAFLGTVQMQNVGSSTWNVHWEAAELLEELGTLGVYGRDGASSQARLSLEATEATSVSLWASSELDVSATELAAAGCISSGTDITFVADSAATAFSLVRLGTAGTDDALADVERVQLVVPATLESALPPLEFSTPRLRGVDTNLTFSNLTINNLEELLVTALHTTGDVHLSGTANASLVIWFVNSSICVDSFASVYVGVEDNAGVEIEASELAEVTRHPNITVVAGSPWNQTHKLIGAGTDATRSIQISNTAQAVVYLCPEANIQRSYALIFIIIGSIFGFAVIATAIILALRRRKKHILFKGHVNVEHALINTSSDFSTQHNWSRDP